MVARGDDFMSPALTRRLVERCVGAPPPSNGVPDELRSLSERELDVFGLLRLRSVVLRT